MNERTKLLGIDFGTVRVGLAVSDIDRKFSFPLTTYERRGAEKDALYFRGVVEEERIAKLVVGLPLHMSGDEGEKAIEARAFGSWLASITSLPVVYFDERFTTVEAESALQSAGLTRARRKQKRDRVAAQILLQTYLEAGCPEQSSSGSLDTPTIS